MEESGSEGLDEVVLGRTDFFGKGNRFILPMRGPINMIKSVEIRAGTSFGLEPSLKKSITFAFPTIIGWERQSLV